MEEKDENALYEAYAYHEAGHAVIAHELGFRVQSLSIVPEEDTLGRVHHVSPLRGIPLDIDGTNRAKLRAEKAVATSFVVCC